MLQLARDLKLPLRAVTEKLAWLGRTGSGKTYGAIKLAELMLDAGAQVGAIDPVGVWPALRIPGKKGGRSFEVVVFGGLRGDLPLEPTAGEIIADLICDRGFSFVIDVSQFIPAEQQKFVRAFADRFFQRKKAKPGAVHIFMEECQEFIPENPVGAEQLTLGAMQRLWKIGRNFGIGGSLISQRPQEVAKKALNMSGTLFAFQMTAPQERKAVKAWVADHGVAVDIEAVLQKLEVGQPHVESPMFLEVSKTVRILPRETADLSSTPEVGVATAAARPLTPIDIENLKTSMAATIEKQKATDPAELQKTVRELRAQVAKLQTAKPAAAPAKAPRVVEKQVLKDAQIARLEKAVDRVDGEAKALMAAMGMATDRLAQRQQVVISEMATIKAALAAAQLGDKTPALHGGADGALRTAAGAGRASEGASNGNAALPGRERRPAPIPTGDGDGRISGPQQKILDAAAFLESVGIRRPDIVQLALFAGLSASGGYWRANIGRLRTLGLIEGTSLTAAGRAAAREAEITTVAELHDHVLTNLLTGPQRTILRVLIDAYPGGLAREELGKRANLEPAGGYWRANLGRLRSLGLVSKREPIQALPVLFLEGA